MGEFGPEPYKLVQIEFLKNIFQRHLPPRLNTGLSRGPEGPSRARRTG